MQIEKEKFQWIKLRMRIYVTFQILISNLISREFVINFFRDSIRDSFGLLF